MKTSLEKVYVHRSEVMGSSIAVFAMLHKTIKVLGHCQGRCAQELLLVGMPMIMY